MKKYLVSGLGISDGGVGRLMRKLIVQSEAAGFITVLRRNPKPIGKMLQGRQYLGVAFEMVLRIIDNIKFAWRVWGIRKSVVLFVHPQTAGFARLLNLTVKNKIYFYVMDNSFFCIRSYNLNPELETECLRCVSNSELALSMCQPFPVKMDKEKNLKYLEQLKKVAHQITFLAQNLSQAELVRARFGPRTKVSIVGMDTGELEQSIQVTKFDKNRVVPCYDLVFHGAPQLAKGIKFFIELAETLEQVTAFIPASRKKCEQVIGRPIDAKNITFSECTWETGLKDVVRNSELVLNPSLWSAPIEGALQKSVYFAKKVAVVESEFGYEREFVSSEKFIRLPRNVSAAAIVVQGVLEGSAIKCADESQLGIIFPKQSLNIFEMIVKGEV